MLHRQCGMSAVPWEGGSGLHAQDSESSLNFEGNVLKEFQLPHHHSVDLVLLSHLITKVQLQWDKTMMMTMRLFWKQLMLLGFFTKEDFIWVAKSSDFSVFRNVDSKGVECKDVRLWPWFMKWQSIIWTWYKQSQSSIWCANKYVYIKKIWFLKVLCLNYHTDWTKYLINPLNETLHTRNLLATVFHEYFTMYQYRPGLCSCDLYIALPAVEVQTVPLRPHGRVFKNFSMQKRTMFNDTARFKVLKHRYVIIHLCSLFGESKKAVWWWSSCISVRRKWRQSTNLGRKTTQRFNLNSACGSQSQSCPFSISPCSTHFWLIGFV